VRILGEYAKAPEVTRERIYLETLEDILASSTKVLVDTEGGNNLLYLPLDQLMQRSSGSSGDRASSPVPLSSNVEPRDLRERGSR
jgi:membrane protease subunit HflK